MFKRPSFHRHGCYSAPRAVPYGATGLVAALARQSDPLPPPPKIWCPPLDPEAYFDMLRKRGCDTAEYERLTAAFPWPERVERQVKSSSLNLAPLEELFGGATDMPELSDYFSALRKCGYPEERVAAVEAHFAHLEATSDQRQEALDLVFARWPSAAKPVKKVIKAVKKKMVR
jgi:hypothetical protein